MTLPRTGLRRLTKLNTDHSHDLKEYHEEIVVPLIARIAALEAPVVVPPVEPPPVEPPPAGRVITPADNIAALIAAGEKALILRGGTYSQSFGSGHRMNDGTVTLTAYPGESPVFDGTGKAQNFLYLGAGSDWSFTGIGWRNFNPADSGVIGPGDGSRLTMRRCQMRMTGAVDSHIHAVYFHGLDSTGLLEDCDFEGSPGAALHSYRGAAVVTVNRGRYLGQYRGALIYYGQWTITGAEIRATGTAFDAEITAPRATLNLINCTGGGANGAVRVYNA